MKTKQLLLSFMAVAIIGGFAITFLNDVNDVEKSINKYQVREVLDSETINYGAKGASEWLNDRRVNPETGVISRKDLALAKSSFVASELNRDPKDAILNWEFVGPDNVGGRTRGFLIDNKDDKTLWAGGVAGGMWKSTTNGASWYPVAQGEMENIVISSLCQDESGVIYVGTGESFTGLSAISSTSTGFTGEGIWKSTDGINFTQISSTANISEDAGSKFDYVNELIYDQETSALYAATNYGVLKSTNGGDSWDVLFSGQNVKDVKISSNSTVVFTTSTKVYLIKGQGSAVAVGGMDSGFNRIELAVAPSDKNYVYAFCSYWPNNNNKYFQLYQSVDGGDNWTALAEQQTPSIDPFGANFQGYYDNIVAVYPNDPEKVIIGGVDLWMWSAGNSFEQISFWMSFAGSKYVHADQHNIVFHPDFENNQTIYFTNDGGVFVSYDATLSFTALNKNYNVTQFYGIDCGPNGEVLGGTQDNGSPYINLLQSLSPKSSVEITGGDGGHSVISELYPGAVFSTLYYSNLNRSNENGNAMKANPWDNNTQNNINADYQIGNNERNPFVTPIDMWESFDYKDSKMYIPYVVDTVINLSASGVPDTLVSFDEDYVFIINSSVVNPRSFEYKITAEDIVNNNNNPYTPGDTLAIREKFASLMAIGARGSYLTSAKLFITRNILNFKDEAPKWDAIVSEIEGINDHLDIRKVYYVKWAPDGSALYALAKYGPSDGNTNNGLFRFSGVDNAYNYTGPSYDQRTITYDTLFDFSKHIYTECDTTVTSDVAKSDVASVVSASTDYTVYALDAGAESIGDIYTIDTTTAIKSYMLNLVSLSYSTCVNDTVKDFNSDSLTTITANTLVYDLDSIFTTNLSYSNVVAVDTVLIAGLDTTLNIIRKEVLLGVCQRDTIFDVNNDTIINVISYTNILNYDSITSATSIAYDSIVKIDTLSTLYDTLINITYKDMLTGCSIEALTGINIDTVTNFTSQVVTDNYSTVTMSDASILDYIVKIDTIINADTTFTSGVVGSDMVWNDREVNTIDQVQGTLIKTFSSKVPTSIAVDPKNVDRLIVTVGGYGTHAKVYFSENVTGAADFVNIEGAGFPSVPAYSSIISDTISSGEDLVLIGTEYGVYSTTDVDGTNTQWVRETSLPKVPVFDLVQQRAPNGYLPGVGFTGVKNCGIIYAGTFGLGAWKMDKYAKPYTGIQSLKAEKVDALKVKVYPNPVKTIATVEYSITGASNVEITVYSLTGKLVYKQVVQQQMQGTYTHKINTQDFSNGVYIISLTSNDERKVSKIIVE